ncbi:hypothetical protein [Marinobacter salexigens]|uniref:hypothetical protein n=1 Tax=Marinobacter salexigens TaxID=1925763 RepID=UPI000C287B20|nr:hypothetical protein [Marinobacter salexigens]
MKPLIFLPVSLLFLTIAGCGKESDELPVDGRDFDGVQYSELKSYTGRVIDGYLKNARVWLDMDGDSQYTPGPMEYELASGRTVTLLSGEPTALSGEDGEFALDISELVLDPQVGPDIDPRQFPLYALALPGKTLEQTRIGDVPVSRAFLLSAAPGERNITPLTTLDRYRRLTQYGVFPGSDNTALSGLAGINLLSDYVLAEDDRAHAYARALARFSASQLPDEYSDAWGLPGSDGTERLLSSEKVFILGVSLLQNASDVTAVVDAAAQGNYANVDTDLLDLPQVPLQLSDPLLLTSQRVYAQNKQSNQLPANSTNLKVSAELMFDYSEDGRLQSISANGCLAPSMQEIARLASVNGYMSKLSTQWLPSASLSLKSESAYSAPGVDERLTFNWQERTATFETSTECHIAKGVQSGSTELGGDPEVRYSWEFTDGKLAELVARIPQQGATLTRTLVPKLSADTTTSITPAGFIGYELLENGVEVESLIYSSSLKSCAAEEESAAQAVTGYHRYDFSGYAPQPPIFTGLSLEFDTRGGVMRPLRYGFLAPEMSGLGHVAAPNGFEWAMYYSPRASETPRGGTPNLIDSAYLKRYVPGRACGRSFEDSRTGVYARIEYQYKNLSQYLVERLD